MEKEYLKIAQEEIQAEKDARIVIQLKAKLERKEELQNQINKIDKDIETLSNGIELEPQEYAGTFTPANCNNYTGTCGNGLTFTSTNC